MPLRQGFQYCVELMWFLFMRYLLWKMLAHFVFVYLEIYLEIQYFSTAFCRNGFQRLTNVIRNSISDVARVLHPPLILIQKKLISYISCQFCSIKIVKSRRPRFGFCYFPRPILVTSVPCTLYTRSSH